MIELGFDPRQAGSREPILVSCGSTLHGGTKGHDFKFRIVAVQAKNHNFSSRGISHNIVEITNLFERGSIVVGFQTNMWKGIRIYHLKISHFGIRIILR